MQLSRRMANVRRSYIREILKVTQRPEVISFAGGLPSPDHFPVRGFAEATQAVLDEAGPQALQYSTTEGFPPLREFISRRYRDKWGLDIPPEEILITSGSQQGLDLIAKTLLDEGDTVLIERPGYLGAIQCFSMFGVEFSTVDLTPSGPDLEQLALRLEEGARLFYVVPTFQNPSSTAWDLTTRQEAARLLAASNAVLLEDNPYGELRFLGHDMPPVRAFFDDERAVLMGSFSKIVAPGLRLGWIAAKPALMHHLVTAKQASDLHTSTFTQRVLARFLADTDLDEHIALIRKEYGERRDCMVAAIEKHFPVEVTASRPEGGMFLWCELPEGVSASALFEKTIACNVAFVPGRPFYVDGTDNAFRLNFSNSTPERINEGIKRLGACLREAL